MKHIAILIFAFITTSCQVTTETNNNYYSLEIDSEQACILKDYYLENNENNQIRSFEKGLLDLIKNEKPEILESIQNTGKIEENTEKLLTEVITNYKKSNFEKK